MKVYPVARILKQHSEKNQLLSFYLDIQVL